MTPWETAKAVANIARDASPLGSYGDTAARSTTIAEYVTQITDVLTAQFSGHSSYARGGGGHVAGKGPKYSSSLLHQVEQSLLRSCQRTEMRLPHVHFLL